MSKVIFLTGATGLIGGNLIPRILKEDDTIKLVLLVRGDSDSDANERLFGILRTWVSESDLNQTKRRIRVIRGDVTLSRLGLSESEYSELASEVTHIIHSAATVKFRLPLERARLVNFYGTKNVMALARSAQAEGSLQRVAYISTSHVCGNRGGTILEDELDCGQQFFNTYEQTKLESEKLVRGWMSQLPVTVFRPSTVVGDSKTGRTTAFNVLYPPLKLISRNAVRILPGSPSTPMDVVPVDFVSDAINHIFLKTDRGMGKTYHLAAGEEKSTTSGRIVDLAREYFNKNTKEKQIPPIEFVPLQSYGPGKPFPHMKTSRFLKTMEVYQPYLCVQRTFDNTNTLSALQGTNITPPRFETFYRNMLRYCIQTDWGKRVRYAARHKGEKATKIVAILNPESRRGKDRQVEAVIRERFGHFLVGIERTAYPGHATDIARRAVKEKVNTIVAVGGDGTINEVANGIVGTGVGLGIIPAGTANDLASYYRIPTDITKACDVILDNRFRCADVILVNGWHYLTAGGIGLPSEVARVANHIKCKGTVGRLMGQLLGSKLYILAVLCALLRKKVYRNPLSIRWNGDLIKANALSLMADNQPFLGRNFLMSPGATNDDGRLDVCLIENSKNPVQTFLIILKVLTGRHVYSSCVRTWQAEELVVNTEEPLAFFGDGEIHQTGLKFEIKILPGALKVITGKAQTEVRDLSHDVAMTKRT